MFKWKFSLTLASFSLLADYSSIKLTSKKTVKSEKIMKKNWKYLIFTQNWLKTCFNFSCPVQKVKFTTHINTIQVIIFTKLSIITTNNPLSQINYIIYLAKIIKKANII